MPQMYIVAVRSAAVGLTVGPTSRRAESNRASVGWPSVPAPGSRGTAGADQDSIPPA
jgi:hypothetical protein